MSERGERILDIGGYVVLSVLALGWGWSLMNAKPASAPLAAGARPAKASAVSTITSALTNRDAPTAAYLTEAAMTRLADKMIASQRGLSGQLRMEMQVQPEAITPDTSPAGAQLRYARNGDSAGLQTRPTGSGIWRVMLAIGNAIRPVADFSVITMIPFSSKLGGRIGGYYVGMWPAERGLRGPPKAPPDRYANPSGFIEVTPANEDTYVSEHFRLQDFLTHDQPGIWPKYLVLQPRLVDKLELVLSDLERHGYNVKGVHVMSGFRTPQYNYTGGNTEGRAELSRHMYGDASDIFIDNDGDGVMDDLNHDGRIDINDARVILAAVDRVEAAHPELVGGAGVYSAASGHGPFIHIDTRGYRARW